MTNHPPSFYATFTDKTKMYSPNGTIQNDPPELKAKRTETIESIESQKGWKRYFRLSFPKLFTK
jgi:hypothetical protein